jgi:predicted Zn-dependent protease with MMP-like domain
MRDKLDLHAVAEEVVETTLAELPPEIADKVGQVSVFVEDVPDDDDIEHGVGADWLGIFEGADYSHADLPAPPRIRIWVENLWLQAGGRERDFREEVKITLLHEIGHYLGLDEEGVARLGLA